MTAPHQAALSTPTLLKRLLDCRQPRMPHCRELLAFRHQELRHSCHGALRGVRTCHPLDTTHLLLSQGIAQSCFLPETHACTRFVVPPHIR